MMAKNPVFTALFGLAGALSLPAAELLNNNFDGDAGNDVGPGFGILSNGNEDNDTTDASIGKISFNNDTGAGTPAVGFSSDAALDVSGDLGFTVTWVIDSATPANVGNMTANGWFFGVQTLQGQQGVGTTLWNNHPAAIGVVLRRTNGANGGVPCLATSSSQANGSTEAQTQFSAASPTDTSVNFGFTLTLRVNSDDSWTVTSTGLSDDFNESGTSLPGTVTYADVASSLYVATTLQSAGEPIVITSVYYDSVTLETVADTDMDGMSDEYEMANGTDVGVDDADLDEDSDGLSNIQEFLGHDGTDTPTGYGQTLSGTADSDGDLLDDGDEIGATENPWVAGSNTGAIPAPGTGERTNPNEPDSDGDTLTDKEELTAAALADRTNPNVGDSDGDLMTDDYEVSNGTDPVVDDASVDKDGDGLSNIQEFNGEDSFDFLTGYGQTLSGTADTDGDGLNDLQEVEGLLNPWNFGSNTGAPGDYTDPNDTDTDDDGLTDFEEIDAGNGSVTDANSIHSDLDTLPDGWEVANGLDPLDDTGDNGDTGDPDMDLVSNIDEFNSGTNPQSPPVGLVDHWTFDEAGGESVAANSANADANRQGTISGDVTTGVTGMLGNAYQFGGVNGHVEMDQDGGYKGLVKTGPRTISVWVKTANGAAGVDPDAGDGIPEGAGTAGVGLFGWGANDTRQRWEMAYNLQGGARVPHAARTNYSSGTRTGTTLLNDDTWRLVTISHVNGGTVEQSAVRLNGVEEVYSQTGVPTGAINTVAQYNVKLGAGNDGKIDSVGYFSGLLDDAAIWDVALSEHEVTGLFEVGDKFGYDAADFDKLRDLHVAGTGSVMIDGATWTYASALTEPGGLTWVGTDGTLVLDPTGQTGLTGTGLPPAPTVIVITDVRHSSAAFKADFAGLNPARQYQLVRSLDLDFSSPTPVDGPRLPAGASDTFQELTPGNTEAFYRLEEMP